MKHELEIMLEAYRTFVFRIRFYKNGEFLGEVRRDVETGNVNECDKDRANEFLNSEISAALATIDEDIDYELKMIDAC